MKQLMLIDASALIYRAYYAFIKTPRINSKGFNTSAIFGVINMLEEVLRKENPSHVAMIFDPPGETFRSKLFAAYKAQREDTPEAIRLSRPIIRQLMEAYNMACYMVEGFEADDVAGTISKQAKAAGYSVRLLTPDKDYAQLVEPGIELYRPRYGGGYETLGAQEVCDKYNIERPEQMIDLLGLMGDSSDNIPGCPGVGKVTAEKLITEFGSINNLLSRTNELKGALKVKVETNAELIRLSYQLATICTDVPVVWTDEELLRKPINTEALGQLLDELEMRTLKERIFGQQVVHPVVGTPSVGSLPSLFDEFSVSTIAPTTSVEVIESSSLAQFDPEKSTYRMVQDLFGVMQLSEELFNHPYFALDTETTSIDPIVAELVGISLSWKEGEAYYIPCPSDREKTQQIVELLRPAFENQSTMKIGQNLKYDWIVLRNYGVILGGTLFDTMIAHYLLHPDGRHGMDYLAENYLSYKPIPIESLIGKGREQLSMRSLSPDQVCDYACEDADITLRLYHCFAPRLEKEGFVSLFDQMEMPLMPVLASMELEGVCLDLEALARSSIILTERLGEIEREIEALAGFSFNVNSPKQIGEVLFDHLKIDGKARKTRTGQYQTNEEILEKLRDKHPIVSKILEQRGLKKLLSTYINALPELINPRTGRIHTSFNQTVAATGRLSSSNPNLQNIPIRDDEGREIRRAFVPEAGALFFSADYSQIELRIMAHLSADPSMIEAFNSGADIHAATAAKIYKVPLAEVTREMRRKAKTANFGIIYGISVFGLAQRLSIPRTEAKELIDQYWINYPSVKTYMERVVAEAKEHNAVFTLFGRKRELPDINSSNSVVRGYAERNAINAPIQGTAADIIKRAMIAIFRRFAAEQIHSKMLLQVHDELNFSVLPDERERVERIVVEEMQQACSLSVPLTVECGFGANWLEAH